MFAKTLTAVCLALFLTLAPGALAEESPLKVLVVTGGHDYDKAPFQTLFNSLSALDVTFLEEGKQANFLENTDDWPYDVLVLYSMNQELSPKRQKNLKSLLKKGMGLVVMHHAVAAFTWPEFREICGAQYLFKRTEYKGKRYPASGFQHDTQFTATVADPDHPITRGVEKLECLDETYFNCLFLPGSHILMTTDHPKSDKTLMLTRKTGKGRTVYIQPGHGPQLFSDPTYRTLVNRSIQWAGRKL